MRIDSRCGLLLKTDKARQIGIRIVAMLTRLGQRSRDVRAHPDRWDDLDCDYDYDYDNENENGAEGSA